MTGFSPENVYQMWESNGLQVGFWVTRTTWSGKVARVTRIGEPKGPAPYFGNPKVHADLYDERNGRLIESGMEITAAGTYKTWRRAAQPHWFAGGSGETPHE